VANLHRNQLSVGKSLIFKLIAKLLILQQGKCQEQFHFKEEDTYKLVNNLTVLERVPIIFPAKSLPLQRFICMEYINCALEARSLGI
jgi:hypothetical protein